ncbi:melanoma-associated antigen B5-like [Tamandua tetradactyla]|uniref:melanoma-associated antigen B5-like n=1 Tax=Tamandua tetradactyla TaxID=48850 RepID=UPI0040538673
MPRAQKSKCNTFVKRRQTQDKAKGLGCAQAVVAGDEEFPSPSSPPVGDIPQSFLAAGPSISPQEAGKAPADIANSEGLSGTTTDEAAYNQDRKKRRPSRARLSTKNSLRDPLIMKVGLLEQYLMHKFKMREPILKEEMLKIVNEKYKDQFPEILRKVSHRFEVVFAVDMKEADSPGQYALVSKLDLPNNGRVSRGKGLPKTGLLMTILGVILMKGDQATEEEIWRFLNMMHIYAGRKHFIYGEPRKLITGDLVRLKYLEYRQVPNSCPPCYEFLWGSKAKEEISKMKVLEFLAKVNDTVPSAFPIQHEEAVKEEEERAKARIAAQSGTKPCTRSKSYNPAKPQ